MKHVMQMALRQIYSVFWALDNLVSSLSGGAPGETISARLGKARAAGSKFWGFVANALDWIVALIFRTPHHCAGALAAYQARVAAAPSFGG